MAAAGAVGFARGVSEGLASARQRRLEEEDRQRAEEDRKRRQVREDVGLEADRMTLDDMRYRQSRRDEDAAFEDRTREQEVERGDLTLADARRQASYADEDRRHTLSTRELDRERDQFGFEQERVEAGRSQEDRANEAQAAAAAHLPRLFAGIKDGVDPNLALRRYNEQSPMKLETVEYDRESGMVRLVDDDGDEQEFTLDEWLRAYPMPPEELEKLGKDDRLVNRRGETIVPAASDAGGGRDVSPYNPETVGNQLRGDIVRSAGGQLGPLGEIMGITDPDARRLVDFQVAQATAMEGRLREQAAGGKIGTGQISEAVISATRGLSTDAELAQRAEEWRTTGPNKTPEQAAAWMESERAKEQAEVTQKLLEAEQKLLGSSARAASPGAASKPAWAGSVIEGVDPESIWPGGFGPNGEADEVDVEIDGRKTTIRLGPDGKVYEVAGSPQARNAKPARATPHRMAGDDPVARNVNATLADARRNSQPFVYS